MREAGGTAAVAATRSGELAAAFDRLPRFLGELDPYMLRLGQLATAQQPVLRNLRAAAPGLDTFLTRLPPFAEAGRPALAALGDASVVGRRAVRETTEELDELRRLAEEAPALAKPLRQLLETIDDRKRAVEPDPRAAATDPPAPDKTHISGQGGFTGMEAIWNYFFWQATSTNALDDLGHVLRLNVSVSPCSGYFNHREGQEAVFDQCRQWLGPNQPGINQPDPTATAEASRGDERRRSGSVARACRPFERTRPRLPARPMKRRRGALSASPVLVGAVTVLVTLVAVVISYSANEGLPFVPTYRINAEVPNASKLVEGNDVRAGGFRVGQVTRIRGARRRVDGEVRAIAELELELDKKVEPLLGGHDGQDPAAIRPRVEVRRSGSGTLSAHLPGRRHHPAAARRHGSGGPRGRALDLPAGDAGRRPPGPAGLRQRAGRPWTGAQQDDRGAEALPDPPRARDARSVGQAHRAAGALPGAGPDAPAGRPGGRRPGAWIADMADTFAAIGRNPRALQETIEESAPTLDAAIASFQVQTPFLARFADLSRRLQPAAAAAAEDASATQQRAQRRRARLPPDAGAGRSPGAALPRGRETSARTPSPCWP